MSARETWSSAGKAGLARSGLGKNDAIDSGCPVALGDVPGLLQRLGRRNLHPDRERICLPQFGALVQDLLTKAGNRVQGYRNGDEAVALAGDSAQSSRTASA